MVDEHFGELTALRVLKTQVSGNLHKVLGNGKVSLFLKNYIEKPIALFGKELDATVS